MKTQFIHQIKKIKKKEIAFKKRSRRDFLYSIKNIRSGGINLIAEIKLASPSGGKLGERSEVIQRVKNYQKAGADAISVVVDKTYFNGDMNLLSEVKEISSLPVLCKDFMLDEYQIYEAKVYGADAVLLIAGLLNARKLEEFVKLTVILGMEPIVEFSAKNELEKVLKSGTKIITVNARNFSDLSVDVDRACALLQSVPNTFVKLGFSGIKSSEDVVKYKNAGAKAVLVGTSLMRADNVSELIRKLKSI